MTKSLLILNYHQIVDAINSESSRYTITESNFIEQIKLIQQNKIPIISLSDWKNKKHQAPLSIAFTFDDGNISDFTIAYKTLHHENLTASFFPILTKINSKGYVNWQQLKTMAQNGFNIGSHGVNHKNLLRISQQDCSYEISESKNCLEQNLGQCVNDFSLPYGMYNDKITSTLKEAGYQAVYTTRAKLNSTPESFLQHRININNTISPQEFEQIILLNKKLLHRKKIRSSISFLLNKKFGINFYRSTK